jgi:DUF1680 family protein
MKFIKHVFIVLLAIAGAVQYAYPQDYSRYKIKPVVKLKAIPFDLNDVRLLDGSPFKQAMDVNAKYLLALNPDRFLSRWRTNSGLKAKAPLYGGWEATSSHMLGHYLSALVLQYASSGDKQFLDRANYIVDELGECQKARKTGYIGGIPNEDKIWKEVAAGDIKTAGFDLNGGWVPWYMLHKIWAGLIDSYLYTGNEKAKEIVIRLSDWAYTNFINLPDSKFQQMMACEFGGMNESLAEVYAITGDKKYLDLSYKFYDKKVMDPLAQEHDQLGGLHANTQIPKIIGAARQYELTGNAREHTISSFFFDAVIKHHSYVNGGNSNYESFSRRDDLSNQLGTNTSETCNTYNMLKLDRHLFTLEPSAGLMDYYERALYNHILASQQHETGMFCYYVALLSGKQKVFSTPFDSFWCCVGTGIENQAKYGESIYFKGTDEGLYVNLFIPSTVWWKEKKTHIRQETNYPESPTTTIHVDPQSASKFTVRLRYPGWAENGAFVKINGKAFKVTETPGSYIVINRLWKKGDKIEATFPMQLHTEAILTNPAKQAVLYGPVLLAGALGKDKLADNQIPVLVTNGEPVSRWFKSTANPLYFETSNVIRPDNEIKVIPFYAIHDQRQIVYWDIFTESQWADKKASFLAAEKHEAELESKTIDILRLGEQQPELDHHLAGENTGVGEYNEEKFRDATYREVPPGGWFSFTMKCDPAAPLELYCTYNGSDGGNRKFNILVDDTVIKTEQLVGESPRKMIDHIYKIPVELTHGKDKITVKFQAFPKNIAGALFKCRLVKQGIN